MKRCTKCSKEKELGEFHKHTASPDGLYPSCKECVSAYNKQYRQEHQDNLRGSNARYYQENRERIRVEQNKYRQKHKAENEERNRVWAQTHPEATKAIAQRSRQKRKEQRREYYNQYVKEHPGWLANIAHKRRVLIENGGTFTDSEWKELCAKYDNRCVCCREQKPLTVDHVIPLSKGGNNAIDNIQPLCQSCNSKKSDKVIDYR